MIDRRRMIAGTLATGAMLAAPPALSHGRHYRRIACEEGFLSPGVLAANVRADTPEVRLITEHGPAADLARALVDLGEGRLAGMDAAGIAKQLLMLSSPGVQVFAAEEALALAREANDFVADACARHPTRFAAFAAIAPQDPAAAVRELDRVRSLPGMIGAIVNSHTHDAWLDQPHFWPIFEALEGLDLPLYIHPREPVSPMRLVMEGPLTGGAMWAYGVEVGTHVLKLMAAGVFDRFPRLKVIVGHMGEGLPFWAPRIDNRFHESIGRGGSTTLELSPSEYLRRNLWITTSGMNYWPQLAMAMEVMGPERVLYATDYPFERQAETVAMVEAMPMSLEQKAALFDGNAATLLGV